jgi:hypothetical protein
MDDNDVTEIVDVATTPAVPWHNSDTVAAAFTFAANIATAASEHFSHLANLATGQAAQEWVENDRAEFADDINTFIEKLPEEDADD